MNGKPILLNRVIVVFAAAILAVGALTGRGNARPSRMRAVKQEDNDVSYSLNHVKLARLESRHWTIHDIGIAAEGE